MIKKPDIAQTTMNFTIMSLTLSYVLIQYQCNAIPMNGRMKKFELGLCSHEICPVSQGEGTSQKFIGHMF